MARGRFQNPKPERRGAWWTLLSRRDEFKNGKLERRRIRVRLAPATMPEREARKVAAEYLQPLNQTLTCSGSATNFAEYVRDTYMGTVMPLFAKSTQDRYRGVIARYLSVRVRWQGPPRTHVNPTNILHANDNVQRFPTKAATKSATFFRAFCNTAVKYGMLTSKPSGECTNPSRKERGRKTSKPFLYPQAIPLNFVPLDAGTLRHDGLRRDLHRASGLGTGGAAGGTM